MDEFESLSHSKWECKYHIVFIPKRRRKVNTEASQKDTVRRAEEAPRRGVPQIGAAEGESNSRGAHDGRSRAHAHFDSTEVCCVAGGGVHQREKRDSSGPGLWGKEAKLRGQHFWARGYFVSTVGRDEAVIREYIRNQEREDERLEQIGLWQ